MGDVSDTRKQILQNTLENELKTHFRLVPQQKFEEVQEKVFEELEYEECTEDQCIMMIQEMLQVENVFHLQVIGEGSDTQLSLGWRTLDEKRNEEDYCEGCGTRELRKMIGVLVEKLVGGKKGEPEPVVIVSRDDEEELRKQREEELRRQREEELMRQKEEEEESRKRKEEWLRIWNQFLDSLKIRGLLGSVSSGDTKVTNTSFYGIWKEFGLGITLMSYKTNSSSNNKYEMNNSSLDFLYTTYEQDWTVTVGLGNVTSGNGTIILDSSETKYSTTSVSGKSLFGVFGMEWEDYEGLLGFRFNTSKYSGFQSQSPLQSDSIDESYSISGGQFMFGIGFSF